LASLVPGFTILEHLGRGAGSHIFKAKDLTTGQVVSLKRVVLRSAEDEKYVAQTEREYEVARQLNHPNLRRCLELRHVREGPVLRELLLVMEMVPGQTLERRRPMDAARAVDIFIAMARGLAALHGIGLIHSDIKPRNVLIGANETVKIIDFGQSCPIGTVKERVQGTPDFLAPEQVRLDSLDERTDVFGLGATMYWAVTGHGLPTPMPGKDGKLWPSANGGLLRWPGPVRPVELNGRVPVVLSDLIMLACNERPCDRPANMGELIAALERIELRTGSWGECHEVGATGSKHSPGRGAR
jgi:serine/threonine protein kinase